MHPAFMVRCSRCDSPADPLADCPVCGNPLDDERAWLCSGGFRTVSVKGPHRVCGDVAEELSELFDCALRLGLRGLVLVHGYGSTGVGGRLRHEVRDLLRRFECDGVVRSWTGGEDLHERSELPPGLHRAPGGPRSLLHNRGISLVRL